MSRTSGIRRRRLGVSALFFLVFCFAGMATAGADTELGGFQVNATAAAISIVYNQPSFGLPSGDCPTVPFDLSRTTATADQATGHSLASVAWPCDFFANASAQFGFPTYPVRAETFYPQGPTNQHTGAPLADMVSSSVEGASNAAANYGSLNFPGIVTVGQVTSISQATKTATGSLSTSTVALHDVDIMEGTIHFDSVKTTVTASSDTEQAKVEGGSTYAGLTVFGTPAVIDADGIHFAPKPPQQGSSTGGSKNVLPGSVGLGGRTAPAAAPAAGPTPAPTPTPSPSPTASPPPPDGP
ncbi:MAG TPA: choice-of-anchor P family protein, partial [Actinomycetota bacterium]|nr:choice-of-anchor P family protein [Actinomycetota bacterium]